MDFKFNHFVIFATSISLLILVSLFYNNVFSYLKNEYGTVNSSFDFRPIHLSGSVHKVGSDSAPRIHHGERHAVDYSDHREVDDDDKDRSLSQEHKLEIKRGSKNIWNKTSELPSFLTTRSSRETSNASYTSTPFSSIPITTLIRTTMSNSTTLPPSLSTTLPESSSLGKVKVIENIYIDDTVIVLDSTKTPLTKGMRLLIKDDVYTIGDVKTNSSWFTSALKVTLNKPSSDNVQKGEMLKILTPQSTSTPVSPNFFNTTSSSNAYLVTTPFSSNGSITTTNGSTITTNGSITTTNGSTMTTNGSITTTNGPAITTKPSKKTYILHLAEATNVNGKLIFKESVNVNVVKLKTIANEVATSQEGFANNVMDSEGAPSQPIPTTTPVSTNALQNGFNTQFHDSIEDIQEQSNAYIPVLDKIKVKDPKGKETEISIPKNLGGFTYNRPGTFKYSADSYIPDYEDSVYLSKSLGVVPIKKGSDYLASNAHDIKITQTFYEDSNSSIAPRQLTEKSDNVKATSVGSAAKFQVTYSIPKTDEQLAYEDKVSALLKQQNKIKNYATQAPLNRQTTLDKRKPTNPSIQTISLS